MGEKYFFSALEKNQQLLCCFFLIIIPSVILGQDVKMIQGKVEGDAIQGYAINIVNYTRQKGTTNDELGFFEIPVKVNDTVVFSSVQYNEYVWVVKKEDLDKELVVIPLISAVTMLNEVNIRDTELTGFLGKDSKEIEVNPYVSNRTLGLPFLDLEPLPKVDRVLFTAKSGILDYPINLLNGTIKRLKKHKNIHEKRSLVSKGEKIMDPVFFTETLGIPQELVTDFVYYCEEDAKFKQLIRIGDLLVLMDFYQKKAKQYKEHKQLD